MIIAFTGTREGMTILQRLELTKYLSSNAPSVEIVHHGDCFGADAQFHQICQSIGLKIETHPCTLTMQRAFCQGADKTNDPLPPLTRNHIMVDLADIVLATPAGFAPAQRSGTWATIRYAYKKPQKLIVFYPDGSKQLYNFPK